ncbi:MAG: hypothetical protein K6T74_05370 [Geminicoccaceae bacterium]|nr:hypothetical protein [Geminicoccaceae bacterium]
MAVGGWLSGELDDRTGSCAVALLHGIAWNPVDLALALVILFTRRPSAPRTAAAVT